MRLGYFSTWFAIHFIDVVVADMDCEVSGASWCHCDRSDPSAIYCTTWQSAALFRVPPIFPPDTYAIRVAHGSMLEISGMPRIPGLKELDLSYNDIYRIYDGAFGNVSELLTLNISNNGLMVLTENTFLGLDSLVTLDLSQNDLMYSYEGSWAVFSELPSLKHLNLSHNSLRNGVFKNLTTVEVLDLSYNDIQYFEDWETREPFSFQPPLRKLYLTRNAIRTLPRHTVMDAGPEQVYVQGNPWDCSSRVLANCDQLGWMSVEPAVKNYNPSNVMICASPPSRLGHEIYDLDYDCDVSHLHPKPSSGHSKGLYALVPLLVIGTLAVFAGVYFYLRKRAFPSSEFSDVRPLEIDT